MSKRFGFGRLAAALALTLSLAGTAAAEVTTVTFITRGSAAKHHQRLAELFNQQSQDVKVNVEVVAGGTPPFLERVRVGLAAGKPADIMMIEEGIEILLEQDNLLLDLMPYVRRGGFDLDGYFPGLREFHLRDGHMYSISLGTHSMVLVANEDILADRGVPAPSRDWNRTWTWDELREQGKKLVKLASDTSAQARAAVVIHNSTDDWLPILWQNGGDVFRRTAEGKFRSAFDQPAARATLRLLHELYHVDQIASIHGQVNDGTAALAIEGTWVLGSDLVIPSQWGVYPLPRGLAGAATQSSSSGVAILKPSKHPEAAWRFLKWLATAGMPAVAATNKFGVPPNIKFAAGAIENLFTVTPTKADRLVILNGLQVARSKPVLFYGDSLEATREFYIPAVINNTLAVDTAVEQIVAKTNRLLEQAGR